MFLFLTTVAFFHKGMVMMGSRYKTPRDDGNKTTETWLVCQSWAQAPGCGEPSLSAKRQTLVWPTDLLSHMYIRDTLQINRDKALFYITDPTITSMWPNSKSQSILALSRTPWSPPTSYLHPSFCLIWQKEKDAIRVCSLRICPGSRGRHGVHSQSHSVSALWAEW